MFLLYSEWQSLQLGALVLNNRGVEAVIVLWRAGSDVSSGSRRSETAGAHSKAVSHETERLGAARCFAYEVDDGGLDLALEPCGARLVHQRTRWLQSIQRSLRTR